MKGFFYKLAQAVTTAVFSVAAAAQEAAQTEMPNAFGMSSNLIGVTVNLLMVLAAIVVLAWVFKRAQSLGQPAAGSMKVTATLPLGPRERIMLIEIGAEQIVVGASGAGLRTLHVLEQPLPAAPAGDPASVSFRDKLMQSIGRSAS